jgi:hypothetical protein
MCRRKGKSHEHRAQLLEILRVLERDVEEMTKAGILPLRSPPAEHEAVRQRMIADYAWVEQKADEAAGRAEATGDPTSATSRAGTRRPCEPLDLGAMRTDFHELPEVDDDQRARIDRAFAEIEGRKNPQVGSGPDEYVASDLWQLARARRDQSRS